MSKRKSDQHWSGYNPNYFKRLVKEQQEKVLDVVRNSGNALYPNLNETQNQENNNPDDFQCSSELTSPSDTESNFTSDNYTDSDVDLSDISCPSSDDEEIVKNTVKKRSLSGDLAALVVKRRWHDREVNELLHVLNDHKVDEGKVPKTKAKLLNTPKEKINAREIAGGSFYYYGIRKALLRRAHLLKDLDHIELDIGIDGARIYHSSTLQMWPKIASVANCLNIRPFLIGKYSN